MAWHLGFITDEGQEMAVIFSKLTPDLKWHRRASVLGGYEIVTDDVVRLEVDPSDLDGIIAGLQDMKADIDRRKVERAIEANSDLTPEQLAELNGSVAS